MTVPDLEPHCGSWVIVDEAGDAVFETFSRRVAEAVNQEKYEVLTALEYLSSLNNKAKGGES